MRTLRFEPGRVGFVISNIYASDIAGSLSRKFLLYDCNDDHAAFPGMRPWSETYFAKTCRSADAVFASSEALVKRVATVRGGGDGVTYLGNGVDFDHFQTAAGDRPPGKIRLGYVGALAPWLDFEALADVAGRHPEWEIVLVGPAIHGVENELTRLTSLPNVIRRDPVPYDRLPEVLSQFSVGLIPFRLNRLTRGVNPNKLYEYLAAGLPVVSTPFSEEVRRYPDLVKAADAGEAFRNACAQVVAQVSNGPGAAEIGERARRSAREHDWNLIARTFWSKVDEMMKAA
jgi:glycosyltransferase involved in cell wall biosynthesis